MPEKTPVPARNYPHNPYQFEYSIPYFVGDGSGMHVAPRAKKCVVFVGIERGGVFTPYGTAFLVAAETLGRKWMHLVTAQHVIVEISKNSDTVDIRFNRKGGGVGVGLAPVSEWHYHPDASSFIDVAVAPMKTLDLDLSYIPMETDFLTDQIIDDMSVDTGDDIFITGLFASHYGATRNIPIVRAGTIAAMPDEPVWTKSGYMDAYLVECRSIGGLSGSPVFFQPAPLRVIDGEVVPTAGRTHYFMGLVHGHFDVKEETDIVQDQASYDGNKLHTGIAIVVPSKHIDATINQEALLKMREEVTKQAMEDSDATPDVADVAVEERRDAILGQMLEMPPETQKEIKKGREGK